MLHAYMSLRYGEPQCIKCAMCTLQSFGNDIQKNYDYKCLNSRGGRKKLFTLKKKSHTLFIFKYFTFPKRWWGEVSAFIPTEGEMYGL